MIKLVDNEGEIVFILEPSNIRALRGGEAVSVDLKELGLTARLKLYYCPDVIRLAVNMANRKAETNCIESKWLDQQLQEAQHWTPIDRAAN